MNPRGGVGRNTLAGTAANGYTTPVRRAQSLPLPINRDSNVNAPNAPTATAAVAAEAGAEFETESVAVTVSVSELRRRRCLWAPQRRVTHSHSKTDAFSVQSHGVTPLRLTNPVSTAATAAASVVPSLSPLPKQPALQSQNQQQYRATSYRRQSDSAQRDQREMAAMLVFHYWSCGHSENYDNSNNGNRLTRSSSCDGDNGSSGGDVDCRCDAVSAATAQALQLPLPSAALLAATAAQTQVWADALAQSLAQTGHTQSSSGTSSTAHVTASPFLDSDNRDNASVSATAAVNTTASASACGNDANSVDGRDATSDNGDAKLWLPQWVQRQWLPLPLQLQLQSLQEQQQLKSPNLTTAAATEA